MIKGKTYNFFIMLIDTLNTYRILLASKSPRRRELMSGMGLDFEVVTFDVEESYDPSMPPEEVVKYLSRIKLSPVDLSQYGPKTLVVACDTIVVVGDRILGKPHDACEAAEMLRSLSGRTHTVLSGLTVATPQRSLTDCCASEVTFDTITEEEIDYYVRQYRPYDKAGAYGVQEWIGYIGIRSIHGSFYNVMGLPTCMLWKMMKEVVKEG